MAVKVRRLLHPRGRGQRHTAWHARARARHRKLRKNTARRLFSFFVIRPASVGESWPRDDEGCLSCCHGSERLVAEDFVCSLARCPAHHDAGGCEDVGRLVGACCCLFACPPCGVCCFCCFCCCCCCCCCCCRVKRGTSRQQHRLRPRQQQQK